MSESINISMDMDAKSLLEVYKDNILHILNTSIIEGQELQSQPQDPPSIKLAPEKLKPTHAIINIDSEMNINNARLLQICSSFPVTLICGLARTLNIDLYLFSTQDLINTYPDQPIEMLTQVRQENTADNIHPLFGRKSWNSYSSQYYSTITHYAEYQTATLFEHLDDLRRLEENEGPSSSAMSDETFVPPNMIEFGASVDLSNESLWHRHLAELKKLPNFISVGSPSNYLFHLDQNIPGMTSVVVSMRIPGCRITGRQQNNNFCSIDLNVGPGTCQWFVVPMDYWGVIYNMCEKHNISYVKGTWWPILEELYAANVPVYSFMQRPGDIVYLNYGSVYWMHSIGWSNSISWAVGPMNAKQYLLAINRYEWNKFNNYKSLIPMFHLSWCLAKSIKFSDISTFTLIKRCLFRTILLSYSVEELIKEKNLTVVYHGRQKNQSVSYCKHCQAEVFNFIFVYEDENNHDMYCLDCVRKIHQNFDNIICYQEYDIMELINCFDRFKIYSPCKLPNLLNHSVVTRTVPHPNE